MRPRTKKGDGQKNRSEKMKPSSKNRGTGHLGIDDTLVSECGNIDSHKT